jgi:hypothetical protein
MENEEPQVTRQRFDTFARTVRQQAGRINSAVQRGDKDTALRLSVYLVEEACLHMRRLNGIPDNVDDSGEDSDGNATDYMAHDLNTLNRDFGQNGRPE